MVAPGKQKLCCGGCVVVTSSIDAQKCSHIYLFSTGILIVGWPIIKHETCYLSKEK